MNVTAAPSGDVRRRIPGRIVLLAVWFFGAAVIAGVVGGKGWQDGWRLCGVAAHRTPWLDLRVITAAVQTKSEGGNPYVANAHDPEGRPFNYPSVWFELFPAALSERGYAVVGIVFASLALGALLYWVGPVSAGTGAFFGAVALSPAFMLGLERGNTDLLIFSMLALGLGFLRRGAVGGYVALGLFFLATLLKIYPVVALIASALVLRRAQCRMLILALLGVAVWVWMHDGTIAMALKNSGVGAVHSYGRKTLPFWIELYGKFYGWPVNRALMELLGWMATGLIAVAAAVQGVQMGRQFQLTEPDYRLVAWLTSAGIYVGSFIAGSSFGYRLWFVLLGMPWLLEKAAGRGRGVLMTARFAIISFIVMVFASGAWWIELTWISLLAGWAHFYAECVLLAWAGAEILRGWIGGSGGRSSSVPDESGSSCLPHNAN